MATPQNNSEGYDEANPSKFAGNMREDQKLLIIHGDMDDNAHFQGTLQFISALQKSNEQFSMMVYPDRITVTEVPVIG